MWTYLTLKWLHVLAAALYLGVSLANGATKTLADRTGDPRACAFALRVVGWNNRVLLLPASLALPLTGIWIALLQGLPLLEGWLAAPFSIFVLLTGVLLWAVRTEDRLRRMAEAAVQAGGDLSPEYHRLSRTWARVGGGATLLMLAVLFSMVTRWPVLW